MTMMSSLPTQSNSAGSDDYAQEGKPGMTGSFFPLDNMPTPDNDADPARVRKEPPKGMERKEQPKRTPEEEADYIELLHSLAERPVVNKTSDELDEARFDEAITDCIRLARKNKEWWSVWSNCAIRGHENTVHACVYWTDRLCREESIEDEMIGDLLGFFMKQKEIGPKAMAESISKWECPTRDKNMLVGMVLAHIFPTAEGGFGWARVGWGFKEWFQEVKKFIRALDAPGDALLNAINLVTEWGSEIEADKQEKIIVRMTENGYTREEAMDKLGFAGDVTAKPSPSPSEPPQSDD